MGGAAQASQYVVAVDQSKLCGKLGASYPIPVEIAPFYAQRTVRAIMALPTLAPCDAQLRYGDAPAGMPGVGSAKPFVTDNGNLIVDVRRRRLAHESAPPPFRRQPLFVPACLLACSGGGSG